MREQFTMEEITAVREGDLAWDFNVRKEALITPDGRHSGSFAISRTDTNEVLGTCSAAYEPVNYRNIFNPILAWLHEHYGNDLQIVHQQQKQGAEASWEIIFGDEVPVDEANRGDVLRRSIVLQSSHNLTRGIWVSAGVRVLACSNGMVIPRTEHSIQSRHMNWDEAGFHEKIGALMQASVGHHAQTIEAFRNWRETTMEPSVGFPIHESLTKHKLPKGYLNDAAVALLAAFKGGANPNLWSAYNALTDKEVTGMDNLFSMAKITPKVFEVLEGGYREEEQERESGLIEAEAQVEAPEVPMGSLAQD